MTQIVNPLDSPELDVIVTVDPAQIELYREQIANQMNQAQSGVGAALTSIGSTVGGASSSATAPAGGPTFFDLAHKIADIRIETSAQGASILEVDILDPYLMLLAPNKQGISFIGIADDGYLSPPIDLKFPPDTDCIWRLCAMRPSFNLTQANVTLTFEDLNASLLREVDPTIGGVNMSNPGESLGGWILRLVQGANKAIAAGKVDAPPGHQIQVVEWISPADPNYQKPTSNASHYLSKTNPSSAKTFAKKVDAAAARAAGDLFPPPGPNSPLDPTWDSSPQPRGA